MKMQPFQEPEGLPKLDETDKLWDNVCPQGFISDFVLALRGVEIPTNFAIWTALGMLSAVAKRELYFEFYPSVILPNLYIILVSPPGVCKKSTTMESFGFQVIKQALEHFEGLEHWWKSVNFQKSRVTPEGLMDLLKPEYKTVKTQTGDIKELTRYSQLTLWVSELGTFMGRQKYLEGLIPKLTHLYDGHDSNDYTKGAKSQPLVDPYVTLLGGTTPSDLRDVVPEGAFGGGLMSRTIVAYAPKATKIVPWPEQLVGIPSIPELSERMAYLLREHLGSYTLTGAARAYYDRWYENFKRTQGSDDMTQEQQLLYSRLDVQLKKIALLISFQRYDSTGEVTLDDLQVAKQILEMTMEDANGAFAGSTGDLATYARTFEKIEQQIIHGGYVTKQTYAGKIKRTKLLQNLSRYIRAYQIDEVLENMLVSKMIEVERQGNKASHVSTDGNELYVWKGDMANFKQRDHWDR